jgi:hypothetical protein
MIACLMQLAEHLPRVLRTIAKDLTPNTDHTIFKEYTVERLLPELTINRITATKECLF